MLNKLLVAPFLILAFFLYSLVLYSIGFRQGWKSYDRIRMQAKERIQQMKKRA